MYRTQQICRGCIAVFGLMALFSAPSRLLAVDRLVPSVFATVDAAEAAASAGDRIIVSPGTYNTPAAGLVIDVPNLQLLSVSGAGTTTIQNNTAAQPVIVIAAPGVIIGDTGAGFTIKQLQAASNAIVVHGDQVKFANPVRIQFNTISGNASSEAIYVDTYIENGGFIVQQNTFSKNGGAYSFLDFVYFYYADHSSNDVGNISLINAAVDILDNTGTDLSNYGVYFDYDIYSSTVNIRGNHFTGDAANSDEGVYSSEYLESGTTMNIVGNTFDDMNYGIEIYSVENNSVCTIDDNTAHNFAYAGIYVDYSYKATTSITNNDLTGNGTADYGIYAADCEYNNLMTVTGNQIAGIDYAGIYVDYTEYGSTCLISDNGINSATLADYGIYNDTEYGSDSTITNNVISGFDYAGIYEDYPEYASTATITGNSCTADNGGADYGIYSEPEYGSTLTVDNNTCDKFDYAGIYVSDSYDGTNYFIRNNTLTALPAGADYGIYSGTLDGGSEATITGNTASGFDYAGVYSSDAYYNAFLNISDNTLNAISSGADYGIYVNETEYDSIGIVNNNICTNFDTYGIYYQYPSYEGGTTTINGNTLTALSTGADYGIYVSEADYGGLTTIDGNTITGYDDTGIYFNEVYDGSIVFITNNSATAVNSGAYYGIYNDEVDSDGSSMFVTGNTFTGYGDQGGGEAGFYQSTYTGYGSHLLLLNNSFSALAAGSEYGLYLGGSAHTDGSEVNILRNTVDGYTGTGLYGYGADDGTYFTVAFNTFTPKGNTSDDGIYISDGFDNGSFGNFSNNEIGGFTDAGIWIYEVNNGSSLSVNTNNMAGETAGGDYGIYFDNYIDYGSNLEIIGNAIGAIRGDPVGDTGGIYLDDYVDDGSEAVICDNFIRALPGQVGDYMAGIYFYYAAEYGSIITVCNNDIAGFEDAQIAFYDNFADGSEAHVTGNTLQGGHYGIVNLDVYNIGDGSIVTITRNNISGFDVDGVNFGEVWASTLDITENKITGNNSANGIIITDTDPNEDGVNGGAHVTITHNCIASVQDGIEIETVLDSAFVNANQNDFDGVLDVGIKNAGGGAANDIDGTNNFFGAVPNKSSGNVNISPELASNPDADGDGVGDCDDQCFDTPAGEAADATGCSCLQLNPTGDADGDGTLDCNDGCPNDANKTAPGACGCGAADTDADADGVADCNDDCVNGQGNCPLVGPDCGFCGMGTASMMPFAILGLITISRRRWKRPVR